MHNPKYASARIFMESEIVQNDISPSDIFHDVLDGSEQEIVKEEKLHKQILDFKEQGNIYFKNGEYDAALENYMIALEMSKEHMGPERALLHGNIGFVYYKMDDLKSAIQHSTKALEYDPKYLKVWLRRALFYEKSDDLEAAIKDHETALEIDPSLQNSQKSIVYLKEKLLIKIEKMKSEVFDGLKNIANPILNKFGLSTENFKFEKNPETGSYSVKLEKK